jgi:tRNA1(Val) A37 N6-methylase TrmN6
MKKQEVNYAKPTTDALLLAAAACTRPSARILDVGCGSGVVALRARKRLPGAIAIGVDISMEAVAAASRNGLEAHVEDIFNPSGWLKEQTFDLVLTNPPYYKGRRPPSSARATARFEDRPLADWIEACAKRVASSGRFAIVHKAERLGEILAALQKLKFGAIEVFPYAAHANEPATRVVVRATKSSKAPLKLHAPVVLHNADGSWTAEALEIVPNAGAD